MATQGSKGGDKNNENSFKNYKNGALDRDGDRSRQLAAHGHEVGHISGSGFGVESIQKKRTKQLTKKWTSKNLKMMPEKYKNAPKIHAKSHKQTMLEQVSKKKS